MYISLTLRLKRIVQLYVIPSPTHPPTFFFLPGNKESVLGSRYIIIMNVIMMGAKKPTRR